GNNPVGVIAKGLPDLRPFQSGCDDARNLGSRYIRRRRWSGTAPRTRRLASTLRGILGRCGGLSGELRRSDADDGRRTLLCSGHQRITHKTSENREPYFPFHLKTLRHSILEKVLQSEL